MSKQWFCRIGNREIGPFSDHELKHLARNGKVTKDTPVRRSGENGWANAESVPGLLGDHDRQTPPPVTQPKPRIPSQPDTVVTPTRIKPAVNMPSLPPSLTRPKSSPTRNKLLLGFGGMVVLGLAVLLAVTAFSRQGPPPKVADKDKVVDPPRQPADEPAPIAAKTPPTDEPALPSSKSVAPLSKGNLAGSSPQPSTGSSPRKESTTEEIVASSEGGVALIEGKYAGGTGFLVSENLLATNAHVIEREFIDDVKVQFPSAEGNLRGPYRVKLVYEDPPRDLAFLALDTSIPPLKIAESYRFRRGQDVVVIGNPGAVHEITLQNAVSKGVMSTEATLRGMRFYQLSIAINPGNSGGPVFDSTGQVIGVATIKSLSEENIAFCIPVDDLRHAVATAAAQGVDERTDVASRHRVRVVVSTVVAMGSCYEFCLEKYVESIDTSLRSGGSLADGVTAASEKVNTLLGKLKMPTTSDLRPIVSQVRSDTRLSESIRNSVEALWTNYLEMRSYVDKPRGTFAEFRTKCRELKDEHRRHVSSLALVLDIEGLE